jgi:membrane associated rhomboid family serine protease
VRRTPANADLSVRLGLVAAALAGIWLVSLLNLVVFGGRWLQLGVQARTPAGLWPGLALAPLLHLNMEHLLANTIPFLILGGLVALRSPWQFVAVTAAGVIGGGLVAWLLGPPGSVAVGASGVVFAYFGWLIGRGIRERSLVAIAVAVPAVVLYGGLIWGLSPVQTGISWQDHLGGLLAGLLLARAWPVKRAEPRLTAAR